MGLLPAPGTPCPGAAGRPTRLCFRRVLGCTPFIALAYFFLWFVPPFTTLRGLWYTTLYCLFQALATVSMWAPSWVWIPGTSCWQEACLKCVCVLGGTRCPPAHQVVTGH